MIRQRDNLPLPRVLCLLNLDGSQKFGSLEEQLFLLARAFRDRGSAFVPVFVRPPGSEVEQTYRTHGLTAEGLDLTTFNVTALRSLRELVYRHRAEVAHWHFYGLLDTPYVWALRLVTPKVRHFYTDHFSRHGPERPPARGLKRLARRFLTDRYHKVIAVSRFVADRLREHGAGVNLTHVLHFVNTDRFRPDPGVRERVRRDFGDLDRFVMVATGQMIEHKGMHVALRALGELPEQVVLNLVGEGDKRAELERLAGELGVANRVRFLGLQRCVSPFMQAADVLVCPSLWREAAGLVNLEALACGVPVVASNIGGIPEYVVPGRGGLLFPPGDHRALAACVRSLLDDPELHRATSEAARRHAVERFSPEVGLPEFLNLYRHPI